MTPLAIGLTGGIGCGKTTVLDVFRSLGVPCFVADQVAGTYYNDASFVSRIVAHFGPDILTQEGSVDKKALAAIVFNDGKALEWLNNAVHPRVLADFSQWRSAQHVSYVIFESAILYEANLEGKMDKVICVYLEKEERIRRLLQRDNVDREALEMRMRNQLSAEKKMEHADWVVLNYEGNPRQRQVEYIDSLLRKEIARKTN